MSYYYKQYEWTAFTEADLLANGKNGKSFGAGDTFTMSAATTKLSTYDNDSSLSGASNWWCNTYSADGSGQDAWVNDCRVGSKMYAESYLTLKGSDGCVYYMIDIKVEGHDSAGAGNGYYTFYGAQPKAGTSLTVIKETCVSGCWIDYRCLGAGNTAPANTPPTFTNIPANGIFCVNENTKLVIDLNASDKDGDALTFSIAGGVDASSFTIDAKTGELNFKAAPDYEKPGSADGDNTYKVIVQVADGKGGVATKELTVNVCDVKETAPTCIVIEAEDMQLCNYGVACATSASGKEYIYAKGWAASTASTTFTGEKGDYDLTLRYWDTSGSASIKIYVNGKLIDTVKLTADDNKWHEYKFEDLGLKKGDVITLKGEGKGCDNAIIDYIKLCTSEQPVKLGALEGRIFIDANKDGIDNAETGVSGVTVTLLTAAGVIVGTTTTNASGAYKFDNLTPGDYKVVFPTEVDGRILTSQDVGSNDAIDSDADINTGATGNYTVVAGGLVTDVDAGLIDPGTASLGNFVFLDANKNGIQDAGETGVEGVTVDLLDANGNVIGSAVTDANGHYLFEGLDAGTYSVDFSEPAGYDFTTANSGANDAVDSDANTATGKTGQVTLAIGEENLTLDAGLVLENRAPDAVNDAAKACADVAKTVDVLANDTDADGDALTITKVNGQSISEGASVDVDGVTISLVGGKLVFDASASAYGDLLIGEKATATYSYEISDGHGGFDTANVGMTYCGSVNTLETIAASLPTGGGMVVTFDTSFGGEFTNATISGTGDARFDGVTFDAYCVAGYEHIENNVNVPFTMYLADENSVPAGTLTNPQNLDMVNWILNQNFTAMDNGDGTGTHYTEAEIQGAIWGLTDNLVYVASEYDYGTTANAREIYDLALQFGEGFTAGEGDLVGLIVVPTEEANAAGSYQPMIITASFEDLSQDCLCFC